MNSVETESYLLNIDEAVFVDGKIVTYSWLSKTFGLHTNVSKQLLHTFFENCSRKRELCATYLLIGCPLNEETCQVSIVKDGDLPEAEKLLKTITSKHIYSVQKCLELNDIHVLYTVKKEEPVDEISKGISSIDFNSIVRDNALIANLKLKALPAASNQSTGIAKKITSQPAKHTKSPIKTGKTDQINRFKTEEDKECDLKPENKKSVIPSMFKTSVDSKKKTTEKASVTSKKAPGIGAFFSKTSKPNNEAKKITESNSAKEEKKHDPKVEERLSPLKENKPTLNICSENKTNAELPKDVPDPLFKSQKTNAKSKTSKKESSKTGKKKSAKKPEKEQKKRKRLQVLSDSESDNSEEEEVVREPTPEPLPTVVSDNEEEDDIVYGTPQPSSRKRKKLVSKTYQTSDGYMVTEKVLVDGSCSEEEESVPVKKFKDNTSEESATKKPSESGCETKTDKISSKDKKESPKMKAKSPQKTKQASLMSFFKKK